jgi:IstB-like ATP binding protein
MLITGNRAVSEWGVFGDAVVTTAILDLLLRHNHESATPS